MSRQMGFAGRYYGAADAPVVAAPLTDLQKAKVYASMQAALYQLRAALGVAKMRVEATPSTSTGFLVSAILPVLAPWISTQTAPSEVKTAVMNALTSLEGVIAKREESVADVLAGRLDPVKWFNAVDVVSKGIVSILDELKEGSTSALLTKSVSDVRADFDAAWVTFKAGAAKLPGALTKIGIFTAIAAAGLTVLLWPVIKQVIFMYIPRPPPQYMNPGAPLSGVRKRRTRR